MSGMEGRKEAKSSIILFCLFLMIFSFGCEKEKVNNTSGEDSADKSTFKIKKAAIEPLPLLEEDYLFQSSHGWLDDNTIIFSASSESGYYLYTYDVLLKQKKVIYQTNKIIAEASVSPNGHYILLYTFDDDEQAFIHILTAKGEEQYTMSVPSREIAYSWDQNSETKLVLNTFYEDWTYRTYILDFKKEKLDEIELSQPFAKWYTEQEFVYIQLDEDGTELAGALIKENAQNNSKQTILENVLAFDSSKEVMFASRIRDENLLEYVFLNEGEEINHFDVKWSLEEIIGVIPDYALNVQVPAFYTFVPNGQRAQLIMYNYETDEQQVIMDDMEMAPIVVSPNGKKLLYGFSLENLIELSTE